MMNTKREIPTSVYFDHERLTPNLAMLDSQYLLPTLQDLRRPRQFKIPSFKHCIALHPGKEEVNSYFIQRRGWGSIPGRVIPNTH